MTTDTETSHVLYRFYSKTGQLLYVGITTNPPQRFKAHGREKDWWGQVAGITCESYDNRNDLLSAERRAIQVERPEHNIIHNSNAKLSALPSHSQFDPTPLSSNLLKGKWFHTTSKCCCDPPRRIADWQGQILGEVTDGVLLIQLYSWLMGEPVEQELMHFGEFMAREPFLYDTSDDMHFSYKHGSLRHSNQCGTLIREPRDVEGPNWWRTEYQGEL